MKNIEKFKKIHYYNSEGELSKEEVIKAGMDPDDYWTSEERAYQAAYDISNDWAKENPEWSDVEEGFRRGVKESLEYIKHTLQEQIKFYNEHKYVLDVKTRIQELKTIISFIDETL